MTSPSSAQFMRGRRGATAVYFALTLPVVGGVGALAIETLYLHTVEVELQGMADSAAHAASLELDRSEEGMDNALAAAVAMAAATKVRGDYYQLAQEDVQFGIYDGETNTFTQSDNWEKVNGVRVVPLERDVTLGFGQAFFGKKGTVGVCSAVLAGPGNASTGEYGGPGLANGHFDQDTTAAQSKCKAGTTCSGTDKHTHQYDDSYDTTYFDSFVVGTSGHIAVNGCMDSSNKIKTCGTSGAVRIIPDTQQFKIVVVNAELSPGAWLTINGVDIDVTDYDDTAFASLPTYALGSVAGTTKLSSLVVNFDVNAIASCELIPSVTSDVKANKAGIEGEWRAGALTIQLVKTSATFTAGKSAGDHDVVINQTNGLLWETTTFWHWDGPSYTVANTSSWEAEFEALQCKIPHFIDSEVGTNPASGRSEAVCG